MADEDRLDEANRLGHLLWEVAARTGMLCEAALAPTALTPASSGVLDVVAADPGVSIAEIARELPTSAQGISQIVTRLERLGFLERRLGRRGHGVALFTTADGEQARRQADRYKRAHEAELADALGQRDYRQLVGLLQRARPIMAELEGEHRGSR